MKVKELIELLGQYPKGAEVMILDGENAGGYPRTINLGPCWRLVQGGDADGTSDCDEVVGGFVVVIGFGCY